jgi:hypothetical protein
MAVRLPEAPAREWWFLPENQDFWDENTASWTLDRDTVQWPRDAIALDPGSPDSLNLVAVLKGDVNGSWAAPVGSDMVPDSHFLDLQSAGIGPVAQWGVLVA